VIKEKKNLEALNYIRRTTDFEPKIALILGSGLGNFGAKIDPIITIQSAEIPNYPVSSVHGHAGKLIFGYLRKENQQSLPLLVFQGRVHFYEIGLLDRVVFPVVLAYSLGIKTLITTNAAGGINNRFTAGDLMLIRDILNLTSLPLPSFKHRALRASQYFDHKLMDMALDCASRLKIPIQQGTYCWLKGPTYETPAEIQMLRLMGVDAVGMSTVPEIYAASNCGIKTLGISLISNLAAGISPNKLSHAEVTETAHNVQERFSEFMENLILTIK